MRRRFRKRVKHSANICYISSWIFLGSISLFTSKQMALMLALFVVFCLASCWKGALELTRVTAGLFAWGEHVPGFWLGLCPPPASSGCLALTCWVIRIDLEKATFNTNEVDHWGCLHETSPGKEFRLFPFVQEQFLLSSELFIHTLSRGGGQHREKGTLPTIWEIHLGWS